jgi:hypothetical protein
MSTLYILYIPVIVLIVFNIWVVYKQFPDSAPVHLFGSFLCLFPTAILILLLLIPFKVVEVDCRTIVAIGGCNKSSCGVRLSDGTVTHIITPVIGQQICDKELVRRWYEN